MISTPGKLTDDALYQEIQERQGFESLGQEHIDDAYMYVHPIRVGMNYRARFDQDSPGRPYFHVYGHIRELRGAFPQDVEHIRLDDTAAPVHLFYEFTEAELSELVYKGLYERTFDDSPALFTQPDSLLEIPTSVDVYTFLETDAYGARSGIPFVFLDVPHRHGFVIDSELMGYSMVDFFEDMVVHEERGKHARYHAPYRQLLDYSLLSVDVSERGLQSERIRQLSEAFRRNDFRELPDWVREIATRSEQPEIVTPRGETLTTPEESIILNTESYIPTVFELEERVRQRMKGTSMGAHAATGIATATSLPSLSHPLTSPALDRAAVSPAASLFDTPSEPSEFEPVTPVAPAQPTPSVEPVQPTPSVEPVQPAPAVEPVQGEPERVPMADLAETQPYMRAVQVAPSEQSPRHAPRDDFDTDQLDSRIDELERQKAEFEQRQAEIDEFLAQWRRELIERQQILSLPQTELYSSHTPTPTALGDDSDVFGADEDIFDTSENSTQPQDDHAVMSADDSAKAHPVESVDEPVEEEQDTLPTTWPDTGELLSPLFADRPVTGSLDIWSDTVAATIPEDAQADYDLTASQRADAARHDLYSTRDEDDTPSAEDDTVSVEDEPVSSSDTPATPAPTPTPQTPPASSYDTEVRKVQTSVFGSSETYDEYSAESDKEDDDFSL